MNQEELRAGRGDRHPPALLMNNGVRSLLERRNKFDRFVKEGYTVADLGCGSGYFTLHIAEVVGPGGLVYAVDTNSRAVKALDGYARKRGMTNLRTSTSSTASLGFIPSSTVDFVLSNLTLCCMTEHDTAVDEMLRVMKKGARAYISITTFGRRNDPRSMNRPEFDSVKSRFRVIETSDRRTVSAALVEKL